MSVAIVMCQATDSHTVLFTAFTVDIQTGWQQTQQWAHMQQNTGPHGDLHQGLIPPRTQLT
jgi:hypothetical protein